MKQSLVFSLAIASVKAFWPLPSSSDLGSATLVLEDGVEVYYNGNQISYNSGEGSAELPSHINSKAIVEGGVSRAFHAIFHQGLVPWMFNPRNESFEPDLSQQQRVTSLKITQDLAKTGNGTRCGKAAFRATQVDESYNLTVSEGGEVEIAALSSIGVLHALDTLVQLFYQHSDGGAYMTSAPVSISDAPMYPHRGVLLDVSRSYYPLGALLRTIDALSWNKMNVFHIHATDSQTWTLEIPSLPELASKGAYRPDMVYTTADVEKIQQYGMVRGVEVLFEVDQPAHIAAVSWSHPELITALNAQPYTDYCAEPPCGQLKLNDTAVDAFLDTVMDDLLPRLAPYGTYFSTGGDEIKTKDSLLDPDLQTDDPAVIQPLLQQFTNKAHDRVRKSGMKPMVWQEFVTNWNVSLGDDVIVQTWDGADTIKKVAEEGYKIVDSNDAILYLSCGRGEWQAYPQGYMAEDAYPYLDWCSPMKSWQLIYHYSPIEGLTDEEAKLVQGSEACLWGETADKTVVDSLMWPRAAALGEVLWSGTYDDSGQKRSQVTAVLRLAEQRERMLRRGVGAAPLQPYFCLQGGDCSVPPW